MRFAALPVVALALATTACGTSQATPPAGSDAAPEAIAPAPEPAQGEAQATVASDEAPAAATAPAPTASSQGTAEAIRGTWQIQLSDADKAQLAAFELVFRDPPPTAEEVKALNLGDEQAMMIAFMLAAVKKNPTDPKILEMKAAMAGMKDATIELSADTMTLHAGTVVRSSPYSVASTEGNVVVVTATDPDTREQELQEIKVVDADTLEIRTKGKSMAEPMVVKRLR